MVREAASELQEVISTNMPLSGLAKILISTYYGAFTNQLLSCNYFFDGWREAIINFIDWIDIWNHTIDSHFSPNLLLTIRNSNYAIKNMHGENSQNPLKSVMLLKHCKDEHYSVVQGGLLSEYNYQLAVKVVRIQDCYSYIIAKRIKEFFSYLDFWLDESGGEIIFDPHYYVIR